MNVLVVIGTGWSRRVNFHCCRGDHEGGVLVGQVLVFEVGASVGLVGEGGNAVRFGTSRTLQGVVLQDRVLHFVSQLTTGAE